MDEENRNNETEVDVDSAGYKIGAIFGYVIVACISSVVIALTIKLVAWILGF